jgi:hypothetical protein
LFFSKHKSLEPNAINACKIIFYFISGYKFFEGWGRAAKDNIYQVLASSECRVISSSQKKNGAFLYGFQKQMKEYFCDKVDFHGNDRFLNSATKISLLFPNVPSRI